MPDPCLKNCHILVAEDEYMLAEDLCADLRDTGASTIGPAGTVEEALRLAEADTRIDGAILDVNLRGKMIFPVVDVLMAKHVPVILATGYDLQTIPERYRKIVRCDKPVSVDQLFRALESMLS